MLDVGYPILFKVGYVQSKANSSEKLDLLGRKYS